MTTPLRVLLSCLGIAACSGSKASDAAGGTGGNPAPDGAAGQGGSTVDGGIDAAGGTPGGDASMPDGPSGAAACALPSVRCVDDGPGPTQEYPTIQAAVDAAMPGDTVLVFTGSHAGFRVARSGTAGARITIRADVPGTNLVGTEGGSQNTIRIANASYVTLDGFRIARPGTVGPYDYDYACVAARDARADAPMRGLEIRSMEISGCSGSAMYLSQCEGLVLEGNHIHDNVLQAEGNGNGIYLSNAGTDNVTVRGNRIIDNAGSGIHFNGDASVTGADGLQTGHRFENNLVMGNGGNGFNMDGVQDAVFVNNVFAANGHHGVRGFAIDAAAGPKANVFIHNTFAANAGAGVKLSEDGGGHVLFNNLLVANTEGGIVIDETAPAVSNNTVAASAGTLFVDAPARDFRLLPGAPAVDAGVASFMAHAAPATDLGGFPRSGAPDTGGFELGSPL